MMQCNLLCRSWMDSIHGTAQLLLLLDAAAGWTAFTAQHKPQLRPV